MAEYTRILTTARKQADARLQEKGLGGSSFQDTPDEAGDSKLLGPSKRGLMAGGVPGAALTGRTSIAEEVEGDDFLTSYYNRLRSQNKEVKAEVQKYLDDNVEDTSPSTTKAESPPSEVGSRLVADLEEALGITETQAAGLVGNLDYETGGFKFMQELKPVVPGSKGGLGFAQWTGTRREAFETWAANNNADTNSYEANRDYLIHEISNTNEGRFLPNLEKTTTAEEAARVVSEQYLRPGIPKINSRISRAQSYVRNK